MKFDTIMFSSISPFFAYRCVSLVNVAILSESKSYLITNKYRINCMKYKLRSNHSNCGSKNLNLNFD